MATHLPSERAGCSLACSVTQRRRCCRRSLQGHEWWGGLRAHLPLPPFRLCFSRRLCFARVDDVLWQVPGYSLRMGDRLSQAVVIGKATRRTVPEHCVPRAVHRQPKGGVVDTTYRTASHTASRTPLSLPHNNPQQPPAQPPAQLVWPEMSSDYTDPRSALSCTAPGYTAPKGTAVTCTAVRVEESLSVPRTQQMRSTGESTARQRRPSEFAIR